jgi:predicted metal-dependent phosphoesterase TrpH
MVGKWLLCDFHIHTRFSDGKLSLDEIVDLYGSKHFDVIAITDHVLDKRTLDIIQKSDLPKCSIQKDDFNTYLKAIWNAAKTAWVKYKMLVLPGMEITNDTGKYHMLGIDIKEYIDPDLSVEEIIDEIQDQGGISVACHPYIRGHSGNQPSEYLWKNHDRFSKLFDAWEVGNRDDLFDVIGLKKFNYIANSDFHEYRHIYSWKTLLHCEKNPEAVKETIRKNVGVSIYLYRKEKEFENGLKK